MKQNNNIESQFRDKLNQRTIEPSDKAWDRLDAMLSASEKKKSKKSWFWIAASLVLFATIGSLFLRTDKSEVIQSEEIVIQKVVIPTENTETQAEFTQLDNIDKNISVVKKIKTDTSDFQKLTETESVVIVDEIPAVEKDEKTTGEIRSNKYISAENLLAQIEKDKTSESRKLHPKVNIDAHILLTNTIKEMDEEHQDKALNNFKNQFQNIKEALSNRNKE